MKNFLKQHLYHFMVGAALVIGGVGFVKTVCALESNPALPQTDARRNASYIRVYNEDAVDHSSGTVMIFTVPASATYPGESASTTTTTGVTRIAGVVPSSETLKATSWGRVQVYGYHPSVICAVAVSTGDLLISTTTAGAAGTETIAQSTTTIGIDFGVFGTALETNTSSTTIKALLRIN